MSNRPIRIINKTMTDADTWYKIFDEADYQKNRIHEVIVKLRETTTADHFRYNYDASTTVYKTSTNGFASIISPKEIYAFIPDVASQILEIEIIYK